MKFIGVQQGIRIPFSIMHSLYLLSKTIIENKGFLKKQIVPLVFMKLPAISITRMTKFHAFKIPSQDPILIKASAVQNLTLIHFNITLPFAPASKIYDKAIPATGLGGP
jgi:hypothetical protein